MSRKWSLLAGLAALAASGCAGAVQPKIASVGPRQPDRSAEARLGATPFVPAGTNFSVQIDEPIDTYYTAPGTAFTATVVDPLFSKDGQLVVPDGAVVRGTVVSVGTYEHPSLRVRLDSIQTADGQAPLHGALRYAQHYQWLGPDPLEMNTSIGPDYQYQYGGDLTRRLPSADQFTYQNQYGYGNSQPREVRVPRGAILQIQLVEPLPLPR